MSEREPKWPSERMIKALEKGVNGLRAVLSGMRHPFAMPCPSDEFLGALDRDAGKAPNDQTKIDPQSAQLMAKIAELGGLGGDRFHTPYL